MNTKKFIGEICRYYKENRRKFPWRETRNPYKIVVSEIMLQQTQTSRVVEKYKAFIAAFPDFNALNRAATHDVLKKWQGLGYNRRAIALKKIAALVTDTYDGILPKTIEELDALPGIGHATAASISAFAFNIPSVFIETNIRRVFIHFFFPLSPHSPSLKGNKKAAMKITDHQLLPFIEKTLDHKNPREWYYALMDYGAMLKNEVINPNRRSKHYAKQSHFEGSNRQIRGAILKLITKEKKISYKKLMERLPFDAEKISMNTERLSKEGFFQIKNKMLFS